MAQELKITRVLDAPVKKVWEAWTTPELVKQWWGPKTFTAPEIQIDFRPGGKYLYCMRGRMAPDMPEQDMWSTGTFKEIVPLSKIVMTDSFSDEQGNIVEPSRYGMTDAFPREAEVVVNFEGQDDKTELTLNYPDASGIEGKMREDMIQGWNESLDKLAVAVSK